MNLLGRHSHPYMSLYFYLIKSSSFDRSHRSSLDPLSFSSLLQENEISVCLLEDAWLKKMSEIYSSKFWIHLYRGKLSTNVKGKSKYDEFLKQVIKNWVLKLFQSNWNNKILKIEYGSLYTSCVIVATIIGRKKKSKLRIYKNLNLLTKAIQMIVAKYSLLVGTSRENVHSTPFLFP